MICTTQTMTLVVSVLTVVQIISKHLEAYTVVHTLYATSPEDALETSLELDGCCQETTVFEGIISEKEELK